MVRKYNHKENGITESALEEAGREHFLKSVIFSSSTKGDIDKDNDIRNDNRLTLRDIIEYSLQINPREYVLFGKPYGNNTNTGNYLRDFRR